MSDKVEKTPSKWKISFYETFLASPAKSSSEICTLFITRIMIATTATIATIVM